MIMPDVTSSYRRIERENSLKPVSTFLEECLLQNEVLLKKHKKESEN